MLLTIRRGALGAAALLAVTGSPLAQHAPTTMPHADHRPGSGGPVHRIGALVIEAPWSRATPQGAKVAGGYMRIANTGTEPDRLVGGSMAASGRFEVHEMSVGADGIMRMRPLDRGLAIAPGETVELKPGGYHIMFMDLQRPLREGETLAGTLRFEKAGTVAVAFAVRSIGAKGPDEEHKHH